MIVKMSFNRRGSAGIVEKNKEKMTVKFEFDAKNQAA